MTQVNVYGAGARALASTHDTGADCLVVARYAVVGPAKLPRGATSAIVEWDNNTQKHKGALPPAAGYPGYWSGPAGYGDVCVYLGGGKWAAIDRTPTGAYRIGSISPMTTAQRTAQVGGQYLGYTSEMFGEQLVYQIPGPTYPKPVLTGNPHKVIYKWTPAGRGPYWALADDTVKGAKAWVESNVSAFVTAEWAPLYGNFHLLTQTEANLYATEYLAGTFKVATPVVPSTPALPQTPVTTGPPKVAPVVIASTAPPIAPVIPVVLPVDPPVVTSQPSTSTPGSISPAAGTPSTGWAALFSSILSALAKRWGK
jgi:hypothetical protein